MLPDYRDAVDKANRRRSLGMDRDLAGAFRCFLKFLAVYACSRP
jgi:hypothetical protein